MPGVRTRDAVTFLDAMVSADRAALLSVLSPDVRWWVPLSAAANGIARPLVGSDAVADLVGEPSALFAPGSRTWTVHHATGDDDMAMVHANLTAQTRAGVPYTNEYVLVLRFAGDRVVEVWEHVDTAHFAAQMDAPVPDAVAMSPAEEALAHAQIQSLLARYYHAIDGMDWDGLERDVLSEDAVWDVVQRTATGVMEDRLEGRDAVIGWFRAMMEGTVTMSQGTCRHFVGTTSIDVAGPTARSVSHLQAADTLTLAPLANGHVTAEYVRTARGWRMSYYKVDEYITGSDMDALAETFDAEVDPA